MRSLFILTLTVLLCNVTMAQRQKKVQFVGGARSLLSHSNFTSDIGDTVTSPKSTGGYALVDLGIKINPNKQTEILGMIRINNQFGGFWGGGVSFDVRQLYVRGVAGNVLRYHVGNIDYKLTPYTFYNHNPDLLTSSGGTMRIKEDILNYESFYKNNTWRQQGASINFGLQFPKVIKGIEFNGFITRLNPSDFSNVLERLYGGGNMVVTQSKILQLGLNHVSVFDLAGTANDSNVYNNSVSTITYDLQFQKEKYTFGIDGESGISMTKKALEPDNDLSDYFIHTRGYFNIPQKGLKFELGYMDNGPDFRSFGAQSKRVDFNQQNNFYNRYTNDQILRPVSVYDLYNDPTLYNQGITVGVMQYNPAINNVLPYGIATFNRRGAYAGVRYADKKSVIETGLKLHYLSEIRGQGTSNLKKFAMANFNAAFHAHKLFNWKRSVSAKLGATYQNSTRTGDFSFEQVNLSSLLVNFSIEGEVFEKLFIMGNVFLMQSSGNDQLPVRDFNDIIVNYDEYTINGQEMNLAGGLRFDFSKSIYLAAMYEWNVNNFVVDNPYTFRQGSIVYVMKF